MKSLVVVGAGPKGMALAAKATVLREHGFDVPHLHVVERQEVGANWSGKHGYTDGRQVLGTPPEKDIGFPYQSTLWGKANDSINGAMQRFSWSAFLASRGEYDDWVDRARPSPCHGKWAAYLRWVWEQVGDGVSFHRGEVRQVARRQHQWELGIEGLTNPLVADGIVMTGPAKVRLPEQLPIHSQIFTIETFWLRFEEFEKRRGTVLIVGTGENAAVAASALVANLNLKVQVLSPSGVVFSRGEGYTENRVYSRPESVGWSGLAETDRREFIRRTDRGVFSVAALKALNERPAFDVIPGRFTSVEATGTRLHVNVRYGTKDRLLPVDALVLATGSDTSAALREMFVAEDVGNLSDAELERQIGEALEVTSLSPRLHLPMLSGLNQGPGFSNLSCLGKLSDRILFPYVEESDREQNSQLARA